MNNLPGLIPTGATPTALLSSSSPSQANASITASSFADASVPALVTMSRVAGNKLYRVTHLMAPASQSNRSTCWTLYAQRQFAALYLLKPGFYMNNIILVFMISVFAALQGCATTGTYTYQFQPSGVEPVFTLIDSRPETDKKAEIMSSNISSDQYGIYRLGDDQIIPDRIVYLKDKLSQNGRYFTAQTNIHVKRFVIYNNMQEIVKGNAGFGLFGAAGVLVGAAVEKPDSDAFIITELALEIDSKSYSSNVTTPYVINKTKGVSEEEMGAIIKSSMDEAVNEILLAFAEG
jgi:hypothetical protein